MKILDSSVSMASSHQKQHEIHEEEQLKQWNRPKDTPELLQNRD